MAEDLFFGSEGGGLAAGEDEEIGAEAIGFFDIVRDEQSGAAIGAERVEELMLDLRAEMSIESGKRLIEQQRFGSDGQRAGQGGALLLAAGKFARAAIFEAIEMQRADLLARARQPVVRREALEAEGYIFGDGEMREERVALEEQADAAIAARDIDILCGIEEHAIVQRDAAAIGALEAGDATQRHRLARARRTENGKSLRAGGESDRERVSLEALFDLDFEGHLSRARIARARRIARASSNKDRRAARERWRHR